MDPLANGFDLGIAGLDVPHDLPGAIVHLVRGTVAALQQVVQRVGGQVLDRHRLGVRRHGDGGLGFHDHLDLDAHLPLGNLQPLAQVAEAVDVFRGRDPWVQFVAFADHPLCLPAAGSKHRHHGTVGRGLHDHLAGGMQRMGNPWRV